MNAYSSFFSSGLLAPQRDASAPQYQCPPSPIGRSDVCIDDSDADMDGIMSVSRVRSALSGENKLSVNTSHPRLRKRRSSSALASSPMSAIRSPMRAANSALQVQRHLPGTPTRSRSGSLNAANNIASQNTSLMGRFRSNSTGEAMRYVQFLSVSDVWKYAQLSYSEPVVVATFLVLHLQCHRFLSRMFLLCHPRK